MQASIIRREFRGSVLFLRAFSRATKGFSWVSDEAAAHRFESAAGALTVARRATAEYGADCAVIDATGTALQPAPEARPTITRAKEFPRIMSAARAERAERSAHCAEHVSFTDGCSDCYDVHLDHSH